MKPIFRNAMFGFHKEDVFHFISKQSKQYEQKISEISAEKDKIQKELDEERELNEAKLSEMESDLKKVEESKEVLNRFKDLISHILEKKDSVQNCIYSCNENASNMRNNILILKDQLAQSEVFREKATRFDQLSSALSGIFGKGEEIEMTADCSSNQPLAEFCMDSFSELLSNFETMSQLLGELSQLSAKLDAENE